MNDAKFIYVNDDMAFGGTVPNILSNELVELGAEGLNNFPEWGLSDDSFLRLQLKHFQKMKNMLIQLKIENG